MAIISQRYAPVMTYSQYDHKGNRELYESGSALAYQHVISKTPTVKRPKPQDLFANATQRRVEEEIYHSPVTSWTYQGVEQIGPAGYHAPIGYAGFPPDADWDGINGRLLAKIKSQNVNLAQALAEYRQTSSMFVSLTRDVLQVLRTLRRGSLKGTIGILKSPDGVVGKGIANRWLQYQYGLKPLMNDIYGSAAELSRRIHTGFPQYVSTHKPEAGGWTSGSAQYGFTYSSYSRSLKARARYTVRDASLKRLSSVGITNPALLAWELIPYSFVFDWLIPVGQYLSGLDALVGAEDLVVNRGYKMQQIHVGVRSGASGFVLRRESYRFATTNNIPMPRLSYKPSENLTHVVNGLALLIQLRR